MLLGAMRGALSPRVRLQSVVLGHQELAQPGRAGAGLWHWKSVQICGLH